MAKSTLSPTRPLTRCPQWPTSHALPQPVVVALERARERIRLSGRPARTQDVLGLTIVFFAPEGAAALRRTLTTPHPQLRATAAGMPKGRQSRTLTANTEQLMLRLPSPVTLRLDALVADLQAEDFRATRRQVVSGIVLHCLPRQSASLAIAFDQYIIAPARIAQVPGRPLREVLSQDRPRPGRRPAR